MTLGSVLRAGRVARPDSRLRLAEHTLLVSSESRPDVLFMVFWFSLWPVIACFTSRRKT
jgi:hypothetical protein